MKRTILFFACLALVGWAAQAQQSGADSLSVVSSDTMTISWSDAAADSTATADDDNYDYSYDYYLPPSTVNWGDIDKLTGGLGAIAGGIAISAVAIVLGLPLLAVLLIVYLVYRNRRQRYKVMEQLIASGQPIPESLVSSASKAGRMRDKGIGDLCLGVGLFFFFWLLLDSIGLASIGILIACIGIGKIIVGKLNGSDKPQ
jgi:hypothetical protein